jgi:chromosome segregation ATPase
VIRLLPVFCAALLLGACATTYHAPSNTKLEASTKRLSNAVTKATNTADRARTHVESAQKAADKEATSSASVLTQLDDLLKVLPPDLKAKGDALKAAVVEDQGAIGEIVTNVNGAQTDHVQLTKDLAEATAAKQQVEVDKQEYYANADTLAAQATKDSKALAWYRLHWYLGFIVLGAGVIICALVGFLKFTGRLSLSAAKVAAKL